MQLMEKCAKSCFKFWPKKSTSARLLLFVSTYTTLLAIVDQTSTKEALKDADNQSRFNINEEFRNVTVSAISKSILWNCRDYSVTSKYYKGFYTFLMVILFAYVIFGMSRICRCCCGDCDDCGTSCLQCLSDWCLRISLIFLLTSYDIDPWACFCGPSSISYSRVTQEVELKFPNDPLRYQKGAPFISAFFGLVGWILGMCVVENEDI